MGRKPPRWLRHHHVVLREWGRWRPDSRRVTPTANRNSYRVAILVVELPRVACFARNPGLGKRNSVRVAAADTSVPPTYSYHAQGYTFRHYEDAVKPPCRVRLHHAYLREWGRWRPDSRRVTPTANRNSYRVAILVVHLPRVACFARNPGLCNRNSITFPRRTAPRR